ncbi:MAG: glycosyltransferase [Clostridia bacterium]|nr:glycosyltransferase [Clostridia bacterium]
MISIVIPVYNGEAYICRCIESLFASPNHESDLEVIAVNDGSRDRSSELLHELADRYSSLRVIDQENSGAAQARKLGISLAAGDYIGFLDADDWASADFYISLEKKAKESQADIVVGNYTEEYPSRSQPQSNHFDEGQTFPLTPEEALRYLHCRRAVFPFPWNKLYRAEILRSIDFPTGNFVGEDYLMQLQLFEKATRIDFADVNGYHYVLTENSASRSGYSASTLLAYNHFKEDFAYVSARYPKQIPEATHYLITEYLACIIAMGRNKTYNKDMIREIKKFVRKGLGGFLGADYVPLRMKGSALAFAVSYRLLVTVYRILA